MCCVSVKCYLLKQEGGQMWSMSCSLPTPILVCLLDSSFFPNVCCQQTVLPISLTVKAKLFRMAYKVSKQYVSSVLLLCSSYIDLSDGLWTCHMHEGTYPFSFLSENPWTIKLTLHPPQVPDQISYFNGEINIALLPTCPILFLRYILFLPSSVGMLKNFIFICPSNQNISH